jgi:biopolymer transport protein ExbB/TolQ
MRDNWMLVVAIAIIGVWGARLLISGPGIGMSLFMTSAGLAVAGFMLLSWYTSRRQRRRRM